MYLDTIKEMFIFNMPYFIDEYDRKIIEYKRNVLNPKCCEMMSNIITYYEYYNNYNKEYYEMLKTYNNMIIYYNNFNNLAF